MNAKFVKVFGMLVVASLMFAACAPAATVRRLRPLRWLPPPKCPQKLLLRPRLPCQRPASIAWAHSRRSLTLVYQWSGSEETSFDTIIKPFVDACGVKINGQSTGMHPCWIRWSRAPRLTYCSGLICHR